MIRADVEPADVVPHDEQNVRLLAVAGRLLIGRLACLSQENPSGSSFGLCI